MKFAATYGSESILPYSYGGTLGALNGGSMDRRFFHRLGASQLERTICTSAGEEGFRSLIGSQIGTEPEQFAHSRTIIAWGSNIHGNNVHLWPFIEVITPAELVSQTAEFWRLVRGAAREMDKEGL